MSDSKKHNIRLMKILLRVVDSFKEQRMNRLNDCENKQISKFVFVDDALIMYFSDKTWALIECIPGWEGSWDISSNHDFGEYQLLSAMRQLNLISHEERSAINEYRAQQVKEEEEKREYLRYIELKKKYEVKNG